MLARITLAIFLSCAVAACGGEEATEPARGSDAPPPPPAQDPQPAGPRLQPPLEIALDDATLGELLALHKKVVAAGADVGGAMAIGDGSKRDYRWYAQALETWRTLEEATTRGTSAAREELVQLDRRIAQLEAELASAPAEKKAELQRTLELTKRMLPSLAKHAAALAGLDTPSNRALVERWKPRFDAVAAPSGD